jgi:hypothetical protein
MGVNIMWFTNRNDEGIVYHKYFNPFRAEAIALVLTAVSLIFGLASNTALTAPTD